jgi:hypothetical protein
VIAPAVLRAQFAEHGFVRVPAAFAVHDAARMCERLWDALARQHGMLRDAPQTWTVRQPAQLAKLRKSGAFAALGSRALCEVIDVILGGSSWPRPPDWASPLVTFPQPGEWNVPHRQWHIDFPVHGAVGLTLGIRVLAFVAPAEPRGGGTAIVSGSHRLVANIAKEMPADQGGRSPAVRDALRRTHPWMRALLSPGEARERIRRFMEDGAVVDGVSIRVVELTGAPGDAVLLHPWLMHAPAPNCGTTPRMMVAAGIYASAAQPTSLQLA